MIDNLAVLSYLKDNYSIQTKSLDLSLVCSRFNRQVPIEKQKKTMNKNYNSYIRTFIKVMSENNKFGYVDSLYSKLPNIRIVKNSFVQSLFLENNLLGGCFLTTKNIYYVLGNKKSLQKNNALLTPYHELFHLCTTKIDDNKTVRTGFQYNDYCEGLNEGYTELLTKRYFGFLDKNDLKTYLHFVWFAKMLEEIIGKDKMEKYYDNCNLEGLVINLSKYLPVEEIYFFIEKIDLLFRSENELYEYKKDIISNNQELNKEVLDELYSVNTELMNNIYDVFQKINDNRQVISKNKEIFRRNNDKIKEDFDKEEELSRDYFKYEYSYSK